MLYHLLYPLRDIFFGFNVLKYITFRAAMAAVTTFLLSLILGPYVIRKLKELKIGEKITKQDSLRLDELHNHKKDTPTMGGILIIGTIFVSTLLWADITNRFIIVVTFSMIWLGVTGFLDDYLKQIKKRAKAEIRNKRFIGESGFST